LIKPIYLLITNTTLLIYKSTMTEYMSDELIHCIKNDNILYVSIRYHNTLSYPFLRPNLDTDYNEEVLFELSNYLYLKPTDFVGDKLEKIVNKLVLIQYPANTCWSTEFHLRFVHITKFTDTHIHFENYIKDTIVTEDGSVMTLCDKYKERISRFTNDGINPSYKIWIPSKMYIDLFSAYPGKILKEDPLFLEYIYDPDTIRKCDLSEQLFSDCPLFDKNRDFVIQ